MAEMDLIDWHQQQLTTLRARVKHYQGIRDYLTRILQESEWKKPTNGAVYQEHISTSLAIVAMSSVEVTVHWFNEIIVELNRLDAQWVTNMAELIEAKTMTIQKEKALAEKKAKEAAACESQVGKATKRS